MRTTNVEHEYELNGNHIVETENCEKRHIILQFTVRKKRKILGVMWKTITEDRRVTPDNNND